MVTQVTRYPTILKKLALKVKYRFTKIICPQTLSKYQVPLTAITADKNSYCRPADLGSDTVHRLADPV